jgi:hypothetical protein
MGAIAAGPGACRRGQDGNEAEHDGPGTHERTVASPSVGGTCQSCGRDDEELVVVRRVYLTPAKWETPGSSRTLDEVERWCTACASQYPHDRV